MLKAVFNFFADLREDQIKKQVDYYARKSRDSDIYSDDELIEQIDRNKLVLTGSVKRILRSIGNRKEFHFTDIDAETYILPVFNHLKRNVENGDMDCYIGIYEAITEGGIVKAGDFLDLVNKFDLPDGGETVSRKSVRTIPVPVETVFNDTPYDRFRRKLAEKLPVMTPSTPVVYEEEETDHLLSLHRAFILAIGYAGDCRPHVKREKPTTYNEVAQERDEAEERRNNRNDYYRGNRKP